MGIIDRVDTQDGKIRIVDYKTGKDQVKFKDFESLFTEDGKDQNKALLQTIFYTIVYEKAKNVEQVEPHLYTVKDFSDGTVFLKKKKADNFVLRDENLADFKDQFEIKLKEKLNELFDTSIPFRQTSNVDACKYCNFKGICQRQLVNYELRITNYELRITDYELRLLRLQGSFRGYLNFSNYSAKFFRIIY